MVTVSSFIMLKRLNNSNRMRVTLAFAVRKSMKKQIEEAAVLERSLSLSQKLFEDVFESMSDSECLFTYMFYKEHMPSVFTK